MEVLASLVFFLITAPFFSNGFAVSAKGIDLLSLVKKKSGNGDVYSFWNDVWLGDFPLKQTYPRLYFLELDKHVSVASKLRANSLISSFRRSPRSGIEEEQLLLLISNTSSVILPIFIACPHHGFTELTQVDTFYNGLNENEQDSLNAVADGNLLSKTTREALNIIENKSKVRYSRNRSNVSRMNATSSKTDERIDKLADQLSTLVEIVSKKVVTPAPFKAVEETCVTCGGAYSWYNCSATDNNQASVCATTSTYNQVNPLNRVSNQMAPPGFALMQNNGQNRFNQNQVQGNNFNRGNNFHGV
ncbi:hypothetical protein Tco_0975138 [Tanacetum coccineum]|uniref:Uncharacterized protein n=1 Tax=Tanacetum coccineum TaxID=301880 RepID=A0ABQ5EDP8_9ASTR